MKKDEIPTLYPVTPLKPRIQPVKVVSVFPVYVIISSSIFNNPYVSGYPFVDKTLIVVSDKETEEVKVVFPNITSGTKLSTLRY